MRERERGSVTAELALALPAVALLLAAVLVLGSAAVTHLRCADAARAAARAAALREDPAQVVATAKRLAGADAAVQIVRDDAWVTVTVTRAVSGLEWAVPLRASATATAWVEP
ncbi:TadE family type IV pilus minor pilin [Cellulomonas fimi]|uniref:Pilus assembly protein TadE n=1 Tax=Cellulomonas fimi TaxID=1708 RepID=A0A7Y0LWZ3_CELFI|nr:TadE family type IV pilus minor pilin [Cellulomonas fimi]NMR19782.1 pilus assembly protein TadE [Cellulomonas fimi]